MKKLINQPDRVVEDMLAGMAAAYPQYIRLLPDLNVVVRADAPVKGKVALVSGGGSGHEPTHGGYVGRGMLDAACAGNVFTSPTPDQVLAAIKAVDGGAGVLLVVKNYTGDIMNFDMAAEMAAAEGIETASVVVNDDVAVENSTWTQGRRGIAGTIFVHKIAGAKAQAGGSLSEVKAVAEKVIANVRSMGMALTPCVVPAAGKPNFTLAEDEMEIGMGIHGEPGTHREKIKPADEITAHLTEKVLNDLPFKSGDEVAVMVNGLGGTPLMELFIVNKKVAAMLAERGIKVFRTYVGEFMTSLEMAGCSVTLLRLDEELKELLAAPADTPGFKQF
ncbi:MAG: phosphoenolpyruvate---glycerone phosphotransferase subunit DhaK [Bacillota bacterium]|nr:phosphoenolpyruvate---glycerone phosphotransferase subunit DhaK [Bacillota bacterium]